MDLKQDTKLTTFRTFLDDRGLSEKAVRIKNLQSFVADINELISPLLLEINSVLITDPASIVAPNSFIDLKEIIKMNVELWEQINFPTREQLFIRTSGWGSTFSFPSIEIPLYDNLDETVKIALEFIEKNKPEQIILHPRFKTEVSLTKQYAIRAKEIPGDIHIQIGLGGQITVNQVEKMNEHYEFICSKAPENLPENFKRFINAVEIIVPAADSIAAKYSKLVSNTNLPVYEFKGILHDGKFLLNLFDYEIA